MLNLDKNKKYLLACSNGPDSMALLNMLLSEGFNFEVAHVNYHLRKESNLEEKLLRNFCEKNNLKLHVFDNKKIIEKDVESECRKIRYKFFASIIKARGLDELLVAHHKDDLIETYLLQEKRKILPNCYGISYKTTIFNILVTRPLLDFYKEDLLDYCNKNLVPYSIDSSNDENVFERNKIRNNIVKNLTQNEKDKIIEKINIKNKELNTLKEWLYSSKLDDIYFLKSLDDVVLNYALAILIRGKIADYAVSKGFTREFKKALQSGKPNFDIYLKDGYFLSKQVDRVEIIRKENRIYRYELETPSMLDTNVFYLDFSDINVDHHGIGLSDYPLTITNDYKNRTYKIKTYNKKISRLYIDWKMPTHLRETWPIIINKDNKVVFVPRYRSNFKIDSALDFYVKSINTLKN